MIEKISPCRSCHLLSMQIKEAGFDFSRNAHSYASRMQCSMSLRNYWLTQRVDLACVGVHRILWRVAPAKVLYRICCNLGI